MPVIPLNMIEFNCFVEEREKWTAIPKWKSIKNYIIFKLMLTNHKIMFEIFNAVKWVCYFGRFSIRHTNAQALVRIINEIIMGIESRPWSVADESSKKKFYWLLITDNNWNDSTGAEKKRLIMVACLAAKLSTHQSMKWFSLYAIFLHVNYNNRIESNGNVEFSTFNNWLAIWLNVENKFEMDGWRKKV